jgi:hypothetical protein
MRITVAPRLQFILSAEPLARSRALQQESMQYGDVTGGIQAVVLPGLGLKPTVSVSYLRLLRGGNATNLDIGGFTNSALLLVSFDVSRFHVDANEFVNETPGPTRRAQLGQAVAVSHSVTARLSATAEIRHFTEPLSTGDGLSLMWADGYALRPNLVLDAGLARGFTGTSTHWQVATGVTYVLPHRIWGFAH